MGKKFVVEPLFFSKFNNALWFFSPAIFPTQNIKLTKLLTAGIFFYVICNTRICP
jgi:hypothetical protein